MSICQLSYISHGIYGSIWDIIHGSIWDIIGIIQIALDKVSGVIDTLGWEEKFSQCHSFFRPTKGEKVIFI